MSLIAPRFILLVGVLSLSTMPAMPPAIVSAAPAQAKRTPEEKAAQRKASGLAFRDRKAADAKQTSKAAPKAKSAPLVAGFSIERAIIAKLVSAAYTRLDEAGNYGFGTKTLPPPLDVYDPDGRNFTGRRVFDEDLVKDCVKTVPDDYKQAVANAQRHIQADAARRD